MKRKKKLSNKNKEFQPVNISIMTISDSRDKKNDISGNILKEKIKNSGHKLFNYKIIKDDKKLILSLIHI